MEPTFRWLDLTAADREHMRRVLDLFDEKGTLDELGLGTIRDAFSNALFPGTSSIQTRLRYIFFVPWIYRQLEQSGIAASDVATQARKGELALIEPLCRSEDDVQGVIGDRARSNLKRLPSAVYWGALVRWGLFVPANSQSWYHTHFDALRRQRSDRLRTDDPGVIWAARPSWHPRLPGPPEDFPGEASFALSAEEASFARDLITTRCEGSLLAWLASTSVIAELPFWEQPALQDAPPQLRHIVALAERFSLHVEGAPLLYNLLLAEEAHRKHGRDSELIDHYREQIAEWSARQSAQETFSTAVLWRFTDTRGTRIAQPQQRFVEAWTERVSAAGAAAIADDHELRELVRAREVALKTGRSRFLNDGRLLDWNGSAGVGRMGFRWSRVKQLLQDLHAGLAR